MRNVAIFTECCAYCMSVVCIVHVSIDLFFAQTARPPVELNDRLSVCVHILCMFARPFVLYYSTIYLPLGLINAGYFP